MTETSFPVQTRDGRVEVAGEWKLGMMVNVSRGAVGGALTVFGEDDDYSYAGGELRYRYWLDHDGAVEAALGLASAKRRHAHQGTDHLRTQARLGLWLNGAVGMFVDGAFGNGEERFAAGVQFGSWPGLLIAPALVAASMFVLW